MAAREDAIGVLENVSGLKREEIAKIWEEVKANQKRLRECEGPHEFEKTNDGLYARADYRCKRCKGRVNGQQYHWYEEGLKHGKASR